MFILLVNNINKNLLPLYTYLTPNNISRSLCYNMININLLQVIAATENTSLTRSVIIIFLLFFLTYLHITNTLPTLNSPLKRSLPTKQGDKRRSPVFFDIGVTIFSF